MSDIVNRRQFVAGLAAFGAVFTAVPAFAYSSADATNLIGKVVRDINRIINSGQPETVMLSDFENIFRDYADVPIIARSALGPPARSLSASQLADFTTSFQGYISRKYGRRFREFVGGKMEVKSAKAVKSFFEVKCLATLKGQPPFEVIFVVAGRSGRFIDMEIEGVSLLKAERAEVGAMLDNRRGDVRRLTADLRNI
ncbi:MlaC/ttg2D family ABC transporter substrate-binding protein [Candidatus Halocynthiibacter alkanivorans]|uniref:MlaC/ttg2D family ABC transporter substrate-binding protein n=1 Tax=Candidatus Halocynthiibacter alkanivorans TaxID=2267619 RepID=UPI000DF185F5|nr:ABC transporter substrate-binding protein [Candidatus Halocynthiibacter alkanivorans]